MTDMAVVLAMPENEINLRIKEFTKSQRDLDYCNDRWVLEVLEEKFLHAKLDSVEKRQVIDAYIDNIERAWGGAWCTRDYRLAFAAPVHRARAFVATLMGGEHND